MSTPDSDFQSALRQLLQVPEVSTSIGSSEALGVTDWLDALWLQHWLQGAVVQWRSPDSATSSVARTLGDASSQPKQDDAPDGDAGTDAIEASAGQDSSTASNGQVYPKANLDADGSRRASWMQFRAARPSLDARSLARAWRPIGRRRPSLDRRELDEDATAETFAHTGLMLPQWTPVREPWFDLLLLIDDSDTRPLWQSLITELQVLLQRQTRLRSFRSASLVASPGAMLARLGNGTPCQPTSLPRGRSPLVLVLTDGQTAAWADGRMGRLLQALGWSASLALLQLLPQCLWPHTTLGDAWQRVRLAEPGAPHGRQLLLDDDGIVVARGTIPAKRTTTAATGPTSNAGLVILPIAALSAASVSQLAAMLMGKAHAICDAVPVPVLPRELEPWPEPCEPIDPEELVQQFQAVASDDAMNLAVYLSAVDGLDLAVMRVVQDAMSPAHAPEDLPLLLLSGLLERTAPKDAPAHRTTAIADHEIRFEFAEGVRAFLRASLLRSEQARILAALDEWQRQRHPSGRGVPTLRDDPTGAERVAEGAQGLGPTPTENEQVGARGKQVPSAPPSNDSGADIVDLPPVPPKPRPRPPQSIKVHFSSTTLDLGQYRMVAGQVLDELNAELDGQFFLKRVNQELETPRPGTSDPDDLTSQRRVRNADWVVLIIGFWYGTVPEGADCSITEAEFRTAKARGLPVLAFKAGSRDQQPNAYRALPEEIERVDLRDYEAPRQDKEKFDHFLNEVQSYTTPVLFKNIDHFRELLKQTLRQMAELQWEAAAGSEASHEQAVVHELLIDSLSVLRHETLAVIESIKQLALLKEIHDRLHRIRQFGIRHWRESVLNLWPQGSPSNPMTRLALTEPMLEMTRWLVQTETKFEALSSDWQTKLSTVAALVQHFDGDRQKLGEDRQAFVQLIDQFASRQQKAFSDTNHTMQLCAEQLTRHHDHMISRGNKVLQLHGLSPDKEASLKTEIDGSLGRHARLKEALRYHHDWQRAHDSLQSVDEAMEDSVDTADSRAILLMLAPALNDVNAIELLVLEAPEHWGQDQTPQNIQDLRGQVLHKCALLQQNKGSAEAYRTLRKSFDDMFFEVDLQTLRIINDARDRLSALERGLRHNPAGAS